jgi:hypothetical protein
MSLLVCTEPVGEDIVILNEQYLTQIMFKHPYAVVLKLVPLYDELCLLGYNTVQSFENQPTSRKNMSRRNMWQAELWFLTWPILRH